MARFCVIGPNVSSNIGRTWSNDVDASAKHAQRLLAENEKCDKLFVVQVVKVVERPLPQVVVRDFDEATDN